MIHHAFKHGLAMLLLTSSAACASTQISKAIGLKTPAQQALLQLKTDVANAGLATEPINLLESFHTALMQDLPFKPDERYAQIERLTNFATDPQATQPNVVTAIGEAVEQELSYSRVIAQWTAPIEPDFQHSARYTHYGRLALVREKQNGKECYDMAQFAFVSITPAQYEAIETKILTASDIKPENLPANWPCAYLPGPSL